MQCRFDDPDDEILLESMKGENLDSLSGIRFFETTPEYVLNRKREGGYYRSYEVEFTAADSISIHTIQYLFNGDKRTLELKTPLIVESKDNVTLSDLYFLFMPYEIMTYTVGKEYYYNIHAEKSVVIKKIDFLDYFKIVECRIEDPAEQKIQTCVSGDTVFLEAGHDYKVLVSFEPEDGIKESITPYRNIKTSFRIVYALTDEPSSEFVSAAVLSCSGVLNEDCWAAFMKETKP